MLILSFLSFLSISSAAIAHLGANTPIPLANGAIVPFRCCLVREDLARRLNGIFDQMVHFGISAPTANEFAIYIAEMAVPTRDSEEIVCISDTELANIGMRLGKVIVAYLGEEGPRKRKYRDSTRGGEGGFTFNGDQDDSYHGENKCCQCQREGEYMFDDRAKCPKGPCCPSLCRALGAIGGNASDGPDECCTQSELPCLSDREERESLERGARGNRGKFT